NGSRRTGLKWQAQRRIQPGACIFSDGPDEHRNPFRFALHKLDAAACVSDPLPLFARLSPYTRGTVAVLDFPPDTRGQSCAARLGVRSRTPLQSIMCKPHACKICHRVIMRPAMETVMTKATLRGTDRLVQTVAALARLLDQTMNDIQALDSEVQEELG